jgi:two-component system sensor histidine kinase UhpB
LGVQLQHGIPLQTSLGWFVGNTGEALLAAFCISAFHYGRALFSTVRGVLVFLVFGVFLAPLVSSFIDAAVVVSTGFGRHYWLLWTARLFSNMLAVLTLVPTIVGLGEGDFRRLQTAGLGRWAEGLLLALTIVSVSICVFSFEDMLPNAIPALVYAPLPVLLWASVRFSPVVLSSSILAVSLISVWNGMQGRGPFTSASMESNVLALQALLCTMGLPLLMLSTVIGERRSTEEELREASRQLIDVQERERQRIARELHDDIGQRLTVVQIELEKVRNKPESASFAQTIDKLSRQMADASKATHDISHGLHPSELEYLGLVSAIDMLCRNLADDFSLVVDFKHHGTLSDLAPALSLCLFRVAQEALNNVAKHGQARHVHISLHARRGTALLRIADDGAGFSSTDHPHGLGIVSMRERLHAIGGTMSIESNSGGGTLLRASAPLLYSTAPGSSLEETA